MNRKSLFAKIVIILIAVNIFACIMVAVQLLYDRAIKGDFFVPQYSLPETITWATYASPEKPITISYPEDWSMFGGMQGDTEIVAHASPFGHDNPHIAIAYREMENSSLENVAK
jgi:hypothetical protein